VEISRTFTLKFILPLHTSIAGKESKMKKSFSRADFLKLGVAGFFAAQMIDKRAMAQTGSPPRRTILFHLTEGFHWHYWLANPMINNSGEMKLKEVGTLVAGKPQASIWTTFGKTFSGQQGILDDVNIVDGVCNVAAGGAEDQKTDSHHQGMIAFKAGVKWNDVNRPTEFGGRAKTIDHLIAEEWFRAGKPASVIDNVLELRLLKEGFGGDRSENTGSYAGTLGFGGSYKRVAPKLAGEMIDLGLLWDTLFGGFNAGQNNPSPGQNNMDAVNALKLKLERMKRRHEFTAEQVNAVKKHLGSEESLTSSPA
jgi:hypothetical protein